MSKDFVLAKTWKKATLERIEIHVEDDVLTFLYTELKTFKTNCPLLWKLVEDFYGDVEVKPIELPILKKEIKEFLLISKKKIKNNQNVLSFLKKLELLCDKGIKRRLTLWGIAD